MRKKIAIPVILITALFLLWSVLFSIDYRTVMELREPVIARHVGAEGGIFRGIGWTVQVDKSHNDELGFVTDSVEIYLFGKLVGAAIT